MKRLSYLSILVLAVCLVLPQAVFAETESDAIAGVYANVVANIAVAPGIAQVNAGNYQTGAFTVRIPFRVDANTQKIRLHAIASDLWKGDIVHPLPSTGTQVDPIPLDAAAGVLFEADLASTLDGVSPIAQFINGVGATVGPYPGVQTGTLSFESSQNNHFSQNVYLTVTWNQNDPEKPMGQYSGAVKLVGMTQL